MYGQQFLYSTLQLVQHIIPFNRVSIKETAKWKQRRPTCTGGNKPCKQTAVSEILHKLFRESLKYFLHLNLLTTCVLLT